MDLICSLTCLSRLNGVVVGGGVGELQLDVDGIGEDAVFEGIGKAVYLFGWLVANCSAFAFPTPFFLVIRQQGKEDGNVQSTTNSSLYFYYYFQRAIEFVSRKEQTNR